MGFFAGVQNPSPYIIDVVDDFITGAASNVTTSNYGALGWIKSGTTTVVGINGQANHPGVLTITSNNNVGGIRQDSNLIIRHPEFEYFGTIVRPTSAALTSHSLKIGLAASAAAADEAQQGSYFTYIAATGAFWRTVTRGASDITAANTTVTVTINTWYFMEILYTGSAVVFSINGSVVATHTTNISTSTMQMCWVNDSDVAADKVLELDWMRVRSKIMTRW